MTLNEDQTKTVAGSCFSIPDSYQQPRTTHAVPNDTSQLDTDVCGYTQRTGQLCGQCVNGTSPPVYSYYPQCVHCPAGTNNWAKYLAVSLLPRTLFFFGTVVIKFHETSPLMNGYIMLCHIIASPTILRHVQKYNLFKYHGKNINIGIYVPGCMLHTPVMFHAITIDTCTYFSHSIVQILQHYAGNGEKVHRVQNMLQLLT